MVREFTFFFLFGMIAITGVFLSVFWGRLAIRRWRQVETIYRKKDRYFWMLLAFTLVSTGAVLNFGARAVINIKDGLTYILRETPEAYFIAAGSFSVLLGMVVMVWLADLEKVKTRYIWIMGVATVCHTVISIIFAYIRHNGL